MKTLYESGENYLEAIMMLRKEKGVVFSIDIANRMNFSKASVSRAVKILGAENYITVAKNGEINFTKKGSETAAAIYERHKIITKYLVKELSVPEDIAEQDACRIEHVISRETFAAIKKKI